MSFYLAFFMKWNCWVFFPQFFDELTDVTLGGLIRSCDVTDRSPPAAHNQSPAVWFLVQYFRFVTGLDSLFPLFPLFSTFWKFSFSLFLLYLSSGKSFAILRGRIKVSIFNGRDDIEMDFSYLVELLFCFVFDLSGVDSVTWTIPIHVFIDWLIIDCSFQIDFSRWSIHCWW